MKKNLSTRNEKESLEEKTEGNPAADEASVDQENLPEQEDQAPEKSPEDILKEENSKLRDQALRALAEADNARKRAEKDVEEAVKYGIVGFARDMISVLENLARAEQNIPANASDVMKNIAEGIGMTKNELLKVFERHGIKRLDPMGQKFDHNFHQAIAQIEDENNPPGTILQVIQAGYVIRDRLLRPAMVAVAKAPEKEEASEN